NSLDLGLEIPELSSPKASELGRAWAGARLGALGRVRGEPLEVANDELVPDLYVPGDPMERAVRFGRRVQAAEREVASIPPTVGAREQAVEDDRQHSLPGQPGGGEAFPVPADFDAKHSESLPCGSFPGSA